MDKWTDGWTDTWMDGQVTKVKPVYTPFNIIDM